MPVRQPPTSLPRSKPQATASSSMLKSVRRGFTILTGRAAQEEARSYVQFTYDAGWLWPGILDKALNKASRQPKPDNFVSILVIVSRMHHFIKDRGGIDPSGRPTSAGEPKIGTSDWTKVGPMLGDSIQAAGTKITQNLKTYGETVVSKLGERILPYSAEKPKDTVVSPELLAKFKNTAFRDGLLEAQSSCMTEIFFLLDKVRRLASMRLLVSVLEKSEGAYITWKGSHDAQQAIPTATFDLWAQDRQSLVNEFDHLQASTQGNSPVRGQCRQIAEYFRSAASFLEELSKPSVQYGAISPADGEALARRCSLLSTGIKEMYSVFAEGFSGSRSSPASRRNSSTTTPTISQKSSMSSLRSNSSRRPLLEGR